MTVFANAANSGVVLVRRPNTDAPALLDAVAAILRATAAGWEFWAPNAHPNESRRCLMMDATADGDIELKLRPTAYLAICLVGLSNFGLVMTYVSVFVSMVGTDCHLP